MVEKHLSDALQGGKRIMLAGNSQTRRIRIPEELILAKLPDQTSKYCPRCLIDSNKKVKRLRHYRLYGPLHKSECDPNLHEITARVSSKITWWNVGPIRWLISPPNPATEYPWFESRTYATCPRHGYTEISDQNGIRQFGRIRLCLNWFKVRITRTLDLVIPLR